MVRAAHSMVMIPRIARREVQNLATRPGQVLAAACAGTLNCSSRAGGSLEHAADGFGERGAGEAPGGKDQLAVGVEVDEGADAGAGGGAVGAGGVAFRRGEFDGQAVYGAVLGRVAWGFSTVGLAAGVWGRAALWGFGVPFEDPVAVAVGAEAGCVEGWAWLAVFAPEAVVGLGVDEACGGGVLVRGRCWGVVLEESWDLLLTIGVVERDEVEVVVVEEGCHVAFAGLVAVDELVGEVFDYWWTLVSCFVGLG